MYSRVQQISLNFTFVASVNDKYALLLVERCDSFIGCGERNFCGGRENSFGRDRGRGVFRKYNHCGMINHTVETYWKLHVNYFGLIIPVLMKKRQMSPVL